MSSLKVWIKAARPKTLPFGMAPACVGSTLSYHYGFFSWSIFLLCLFSALFLQIGANFANDVFDYENGADLQNRIGPDRAVASGTMSSNMMKAGMIVVFAVAFLFAFPLIIKEGSMLALIFLCVVLIAISYSGGPFPLAYLGLGELTNLIFMAGLPTLMMFYMQTHQFSFAAFWLGICIGGLTSAVMCMNNLRDEITDRESNKGTLVVRFGQTFGKYEFAFLTLYPFILPWVIIYFFSLPIEIGGVSLLIFPAIHLVRVTFSAVTPQDFMAIFSQVALLALFYIIVLSYGLLI